MMTAREIVAALDRAAERWRGAARPERLAAARVVAARTGYDRATVNAALEALFGELTATALTATIVDELGSLEVLDGFLERPGRPAAHARGVERVVVVSSATTIGVAIPAAAFALCAGARVVVKDRDDDLVARFRATLVAIEPRLAERFIAERWAAHDDPHMIERLASADVAVVFGGADALRAIRTRLAPTARLLPFGHRVSVAYVEREAAAERRGRTGARRGASCATRSFSTATAACRRASSSSSAAARFRARPSPRG